MLDSKANIMLQAIADYLYPVGSYYYTESSELDTVEKMNAHFGGTWEAIVDKFIYASSVAGQEGGEVSHTLTIEEMPSHAHPQDAHTHGLRSPNVGNYWTGNTNSMLNPNKANAYIGMLDTGGNNGENYPTHNAGGFQIVSNVQPTIHEIGGSQPHNNMPPYRTAFVYKRTSLSGGA